MGLDFFLEGASSFAKDHGMATSCVTAKDYMPHLPCIVGMENNHQKNL